MILVDITFPELNETIDFQLDENVSCWDVLEDVSDLVAKRYGRQYSRDGVVLLYSAEQRTRLDLNQSLKANGVQSGDRLLLL